MEVLPERLIELDGILVDRRIFTTQFICDVVLQQCGSACCHRGCIITSAEIARVKSHDGITQYLPEQKRDRKSTRLNSSHRTISYAVFCLKKKKLHVDSDIHYFRQ